eukprot:COSAG02_NODE_20565_length_825_cov_1.239669_1_plen_155_part_10
MLDEFDEIVKALEEYDQNDKGEKEASQKIDSSVEVIDRMIRDIIAKHKDPPFAAGQIVLKYSGIEDSRNQSIRVFFLALLLIFPMVVRTMIDAKLCRALNSDDSWMMVDLEVPCRTGGGPDAMYSTFEPWFSFGAFLYPVGIPMGIMFLLGHDRR